MTTLASTAHLSAASLALLFVQAVPPGGDFQLISGLGIGGILAFVVMRYYREDRRASEDRYAALATDFRKTVVENTAAITQNTGAITNLRDMITGCTEHQSAEHAHRKGRDSGGAV